MKTLVVVLIVLVVAVVIFLLRHTSDSASRLDPHVGEGMTLEQKLSMLAECGLKLCDPFRPDDLLTSWDRSAYEKPGFDLVLVGLGMTEEEKPWRNHCANLWHFDTECIEDHGSYKRIAERMVEMAEGSLPLENIRDHVDVENKEAWLAFSFQGKEIKIDCKVEDDWVDTTVFDSFVRLLKISAPSKIYVYYDLGGQDCIIGCVTREQLENLNKRGIKFVPLT